MARGLVENKKGFFLKDWKGEDWGARESQGRGLVLRKASGKLQSLCAEYSWPCSASVSP